MAIWHISIDHNPDQGKAVPEKEYFFHKIGCNGISDILWVTPPWISCFPQVVRCCLLHIIHKARHIASNRRSIFFRAAHHAAEMEAYSCALCQLRALLYLAQRLLHDNSHGNLFFQDENGLSQLFLREYASMHKGCFYGRCVGFQVRVCLWFQTFPLVFCLILFICMP